MTLELANLLWYYKNGKLYWKIKISDKIIPNQEAGNKFGKYAIVKYDKKTYQVHRIIFLLHHGYLPTTVDHIDLNPKNNLISNLRDASYSENLRNTRKLIKAHSKYKGVTLDKRRKKKWIARIKLIDKRLHLGYYENEIDAAKAYDQAAIKYFGKFANLNFKGEFND